MTAQDNSGVPSWVRVGAQCVCINDEWRLPMRSPLHRVPMVNEVLTVVASEHRGEKCFSFVTCPAGFFVEFEEVPNHQGNWAGIMWPVSHFRPLHTVSFEQDISQFTHLLSGMPVDA